jgi:hypothetical protein
MDGEMRKHGDQCCTGNSCTRMNREQLRKKRISDALWIAGILVAACVASCLMNWRIN